MAAARPLGRPRQDADLPQLRRGRRSTEADRQRRRHWASSAAAADPRAVRRGDKRAAGFDASRWGFSLPAGGLARELESSDERASTPEAIADANTVAMRQWCEKIGAAGKKSGSLNAILRKEVHRRNTEPEADQPLCCFSPGRAQQLISGSLSEPSIGAGGVARPQRRCELSDAERTKLVSDMEKRFRQANFPHGDAAPRPSSSGSAQRPLMQRPRQLLDAGASAEALAAENRGWRRQDGQVSYLRAGMRQGVSSNPNAWDPQAAEPDLLSPQHDKRVASLRAAFFRMADPNSDSNPNTDTNSNNRTIARDLADPGAARKMTTWRLHPRPDSRRKGGGGIEPELSPAQTPPSPPEHAERAERNEDGEEVIDPRHHAELRADLRAKRAVKRMKEEQRKREEEARAVRAAKIAGLAAAEAATRREAARAAKRGKPGTAEQQQGGSAPAALPAPVAAAPSPSTVAGGRVATPTAPPAAVAQQKQPAVRRKTPVRRTSLPTESVPVPASSPFGPCSICFRTASWFSPIQTRIQNRPGSEPAGRSRRTKHRERRYPPCSARERMSAPSRGHSERPGPPGPRGPPELRKRRRTPATQQKRIPRPSPSPGRIPSERFSRIRIRRKRPRRRGGGGGEGRRRLRRSPPRRGGLLRCPLDALASAALALCCVLTGSQATSSRSICSSALAQSCCLVCGVSLTHRPDSLPAGQRASAGGGAQVRNHRRYSPDPTRLCSSHPLTKASLVARAVWLDRRRGCGARGTQHSNSNRHRPRASL